MAELLLQEPPPAPAEPLGRRLLRSPLAWAFAAELLLAGGIGVLAWHIVTQHHSVSALLPDVWPSPPAESPLPQVTVPGAGHARAASRAHLNTDPSFVRGQLSQINRDQAGWERAEWTLVSVVMQVARGYLDRVVVPAVEHASAHSP